MAATSEPKSIYEFTVMDAKGNDVDLSIYKGKVLLIVNVASECGLTNSNYTELAQLYQKYKDHGINPVDVNGDNAAPICKFLKSSKGGMFGEGIKWNFAKFLVDKDGDVVDRYTPTTSPLSIEKDLKKLLGVTA